MEKVITINGTSAYINAPGEAPTKISEDVTFTLPEVASLTTTVSAMGDFDVPVIGQIGDMEGSLHHTGVDTHLVKLLRQKILQLDLRWAQQIFKDDGSSGIAGCQAILTIFPKVIAPEISVEKGSAPDFEVKYGITKYQLIRDGVTLWNIDRLNHKLEIAGVDYYTDIGSVL